LPLFFAADPKICLVKSTPTFNNKAMKRALEAHLLRWKDQKTRMPLLVRGARQVGKSYVIESFGKTHFESFVLVNFEQHPEYKGCFNPLDPVKIVSALELMTGIAIRPGKTLLSR
jgi:hypothetical protein